jgi:hypothetical protein
MTLSSYRSSPARLVRLFRASRDLWKQRAAAKQEQIRSLRVKVRDLAASRDYWKERALRARPAAADTAAAPGPAAGHALGGRPTASLPPPAPAAPAAGHALGGP